MSGIPDYALETTFDFKFTTRSFSTGAPTTLAGTPAVEIYEDNSLTQITGASALTVDFDGVTGMHNLRITATAANGFESGKSYAAVISAGTVGGVSVVGEVLLNFSIERTSALRPTAAGRTLDVTATGAAGIDWGNVENPTTAVDLSATDIQLCDTITTYTGNTVQTGDSFARLGAPAGVSVSADIADIPTVAEFNARTLAAADYFDPAADTVANVTTVATLTGHTAQTGDSFARLGAPAGASVSADIAALNDISAADVNTQVSDVMKTDTISEMTQGIPPATPTFEEAVMYLYMAFRNKLDVTATLKEFHNDAGAVICKKTLSDDGTTYSEAETASGP